MSKAKTYVPLNDVLDEITSTFLKITISKNKNTADIYEEYLKLREKLNNLNTIYGIRVEEEDDLK